MTESQGQDHGEQVDPIEFLRAALKISPEDAKQVREDAAKRGSDPSREEPPPSGPLGPSGG